VETLLDLVRQSGFKEKLKSFSKVIARLFDSVTLARNVQLRAERNIAISLTFDDSCKLLFQNMYSSLLIWRLTERELSGALLFEPSFAVLAKVQDTGVAARV